MQLYIFTPSQKSGYRMVEKQFGTRPRCGSMSLYRYSGQVTASQYSILYSYNTPNISIRLGKQNQAPPLQIICELK